MVGCTRTVSVKELFILKGYWELQTLLINMLTIEHAEIQTNTVAKNKLCRTCCIILSFFFFKVQFRIVNLYICATYVFPNL